MDNLAAPKVQFLQRQAASLLLYQSVLQGEVGNAFLDLLQSIRYTEADGRNCLEAYGTFFQSLALRNQNWEEYLITQILRTENPFSRHCQKCKFANLPVALISALKHDLQALQHLYECSSATLSIWVQTVAHLATSPVVWYVEQDGVNRPHELAMVEKFQQTEDWTEVIEDLAVFYQQYGSGLFAEYTAIRWQNGEFIGVPHPDTVELEQLVGYETQKATLLKNTEFLLSGQPALHVLLYGSRGTGKSSLVKALLNKYGDRNLRLVEVTKSELRNLPAIVERLRDTPQKFIIFVDDLSFEEDDDAFKALKVVLEGNITARPQNVVVYATSNRRHLIREFFSDRPAPKDREEVHPWDTMQEKLSFSDRFGLTLTFEPADQPKYLEIIHHLAAIAQIPLSREDLEYQALQWATRHNGRSGRTARQFIDFFQADLTFTSDTKATIK
ncbi:ATP-binding protein [Calothrix sp. 336/3]|uniref:ATP-binding protein n=1 Tax=Calothrix sp. 336/3 TaxID=1337936 RepID=UPI0004E3191E|nr:ATP-binding protein [Calothrix sp. 336/3]AKG22330.1 ATPase (AAA+ superfamily) [Calothrix sp. 336/3]